MARRTGTITLALLATLALAAPAAAENISIINPIYHDDSGETLVVGGPYTASGPAVEDDLVCANGHIAELWGHGVTLPDDDFRVLVVKELTCEDRPGVLEIALWADRVEGVGNTFEWQVLWGTEAFEGLCGGGTGLGAWAEDPAVIDSYSGTIGVCEV